MLAIRKVLIKLQSRHKENFLSIFTKDETIQEIFDILDIKNKQST